MMAARFLRCVAARAACALFLGMVSVAVAAPVRADDYGRAPPHDDYGRAPPHDEHDRGREHRERPERRAYRPPPPEVVYAPPPVIYAPPSPPPGLSIIIPFNFR